MEVNALHSVDVQLLGSSPAENPFEVKCFFRKASSSSKGGTLYGFIVGRMRDTIAIRNLYLQEFNTPFPDSIYFVENFRADDCGKISFKNLLASAYHKSTNNKEPN